MCVLIKIKLKPIKKLFYNEASNYGIYSCETTEKDKIKLNDWGNFSIKGVMPSLIVGNEYIAKLQEKEDKKYGVTYEVQYIYEEIPSDIEKQKVYLETILNKNQVEAIYKAYPNQDIIKLIQNDEFDVSKVKGIGLKTLAKIKEKIEDNIEFREALEFLIPYGIDSKLIRKLVKHYKSPSLLVFKVKQSPYNLLVVKGIGFKKADAIAMKMNFPKVHPHRITSAIEYIIEEEEKLGHTYITVANLVKKVSELIEVGQNEIVKHVKESDNIRIYGDKVALKSTYNAELYVAKRLKEILANSNELKFDVEKFIEEQEKATGFQFTHQQKSFFYNVKKYNVNFLVGFAGCGKSQLTKFLINLCDKLGLTYKILSPTGKAAKVISTYTGRKAYTIHRAIGIRGDQEEIIPIKEDFIIIDEASMLDIKLAAKLLSRLSNPNVRILFVGDSFQIPSVGAGCFLHDCMKSGILPMTKLDIVFRQKDGGILDVATNIRLKKKFVENDFFGIKKIGNDCILASVPQDKMESGYKYFYKELLKEYSPEQIMVLSPTKKGKLGTEVINKHVQEQVNPSDDKKKEIAIGKDKDVIFREGDYVINTKNTYRIFNIDEMETDIVNGDTGTIVKIDEFNKEVIVDFEFDIVPIPLSDLGQLQHSWSITKHKSQGSGVEAVIVIADKSHKFQLSANLLYTACTRAKKMLVILTQAETLNYAMKKIANLQRNTFLKDMLLNKI
jgi:exodeoxyribonuclease V alpha subunit